MKKIPTFILVTMLLWTFPQGCSSEDDSKPSEQVVKDQEPEEEEDSGTLLNLYIVDAPGDYLEVWVEVTGVEIVVDNNTIPLELIWANSTGQPDVEILNLLEYTGGGYDVLIGEHNIPLGELSAVILKIGDKNSVVTSDGTTHSLTLTEETKDGIRIPFNHSAKEGVTNELTIDFDVDASLSKKEASQGYQLDPQIRGFDNHSTGNIYGYLESTLGQNPALVTVTSGEVTYSTQTWDNEFMLWGLPPGVHDVTFTFYEASEIEDLVVTGVEVTAGKRTDIGPLSH